jgi:hypothetical protein
MWSRFGESLKNSSINTEKPNKPFKAQTCPDGAARRPNSAACASLKKSEWYVNKKIRGVLCHEYAASDTR